MKLWIWVLSVIIMAVGYIFGLPLLFFGGILGYMGIFILLLIIGALVQL